MFQLLGLLFLAGAIVLIARWLLLGAAVVAGLWLIGKAVDAWFEAKQRRRRARDAIRRRADEQHQALLSGDVDRGTYGDYPPCKPFG